MPGYPVPLRIFNISHFALPRGRKVSIPQALLSLFSRPPPARPSLSSTSSHTRTPALVLFLCLVAPSFGSPSRLSSVKLPVLPQMSQANAFECRQRQLCELEALQSMYDVDGSFVVDDTDAHELLKATVDSCSSPEEFDKEGLPSLSFRIAHSDAQEPSVSHTVSFLLPEQYPASQHAVCRIEWGVGNRADHEFLNGVIDQYSESLTGEESCFSLVQRARELIQEAQAEKTQDIAEDLALQEAVRMVQEVQISERKRVLGRRLIYFHHIINEGKRQCIIEWAVQLKLGGYSKIGWPGVIVVEGPEECCQEYVRSLQRLRWQLMVVRGEEMEDCPEDSTIDDLRKMHRGFEETDNMSLLAERCRQAGLEELFLTSMKIYGGRGAEEGKKGAGSEQAEARGKKASGGKQRR